MFVLVMIVRFTEQNKNAEMSSLERERYLSAKKEKERIKGKGHFPYLRGGKGSKGRKGVASFDLTKLKIMCVKSQIKDTTLNPLLLPLCPSLILVCSSDIR